VSDVRRSWQPDYRRFLPGIVPACLTVFLAAIILIFGLPWGNAIAQKVPESFQGPSVAATYFEGKPQEYAGTERCRSCHKPEYRAFELTPHAGLSVPGKGYISGCEVCHGPGKAHSDAVEAAEGEEGKTLRALKEHPIFSFSVNQKITAALRQYPIFHFRSNAKENAAHCLLCHISSKRQEFFEHSTHVAHGLSCDQCHTTHLVEEVKDESKGDMSYPQGYFFQLPQIPDQVRWLHNSLLKEPEPELCFTCHRTVQAEFALPVHHRVPEGLMKCTDCHNPHGTENLASLNRPNFETCVNCHVEKRGPYIYEHPAVKIEGCVACHNPHGTLTRMLLVRREGRMLCLQCHTGFHGQAGVPHGRLGFQTSGECTRCHVAVHGSNLDPDFLR
jgi:predicted CXXCH cytochrome family protein